MGCSGKSAIPSDLVDRSFLTSNPCKAPCWYGMYPQRTSFNQAVDELGRLNFISHEIEKQSIEMRVMVSKQKVLTTKPAVLLNVSYLRKSNNEKRHTVASLVFVDDVLNVIALNPTEPILLEDLLTTYGSPD
jgi:hypothetical protein